MAFTSANAVRAFDERANLARRVPAPKRIAVVGPATARAVESIGLRVDVMPPIFTAESLGETLQPEARGRNFLLVLAEHAPAVLGDALAAAGANVTVAAAYGNHIPGASLSAIAELFSHAAKVPDVVTFTSASTVSNLAALLEAAGLKMAETAIRASIGPITSRALRALGWPPHVEAAEPTIAEMVAAVEQHFHAAR